MVNICLLFHALNLRGYRLHASYTRLNSLVKKRKQTTTTYMYSPKVLIAAATLAAAVVNAAPFERVFIPTGPDAINRSTGSFTGFAEYNGGLYVGGPYSQVTNDGSGNITTNFLNLRSADGGNTWTGGITQSANQTIDAVAASDTTFVGVGGIITPGSITFPGFSVTFNEDGNPVSTIIELEDGISSFRGLTVAYGNGVFVYGSLSGVLFTSTNGLNWTRVDWELDGVIGRDISEIIWDGSQFVLLVGTDVYTSTDGETWTRKEDNLGFSSPTEIAYGNGLYVAGGAVGGLQQGTILTSTDLETWTEIDMTFAQPITDIAYGGGYFVAVTGRFGGNGLLYYSADGQTWTEFDAELQGIQLTAVDYLENDWFIAGHSSSSFFDPGIWKATSEFPPQANAPDPEPEPDTDPWANAYPAGATNAYYDANLGFFYYDPTDGLWTYNYLLGWIYPVGDYSPNLWMYVIDQGNWMYSDAGFVGFSFRVDTGLWYYYDVNLDTFIPAQ